MSNDAPPPTTRTGHEIPGWVWASAGLLFTIFTAVFFAGREFGELRARVASLESSMQFVADIIKPRLQADGIVDHNVWIVGNEPERE